MLFSDFHWGKGRDNEVKLESNDVFIDWMIGKCKLNKISTVIFTGDWFDNRNSISVKTSYMAYKSVERISAAGLKLIMLVGNHDAYLKDSISINSISAYKNIDNVYIIEKYEEISICGNRVGIVPWEEQSGLNGSYACIFGHFEFMGAKLTANNVLEHGINPGDLLKFSPMIYSGHIHYRNDYQYKNGKIMTVGCPLPLDWGDCGNEKGVYIIDGNDFSYSFIKNDCNAEYKKIYLSQLPKGLDEVSGNYIKLVIDKECDFDKVLKIVGRINEMKPIVQCETEFLYSSKIKLDEATGKAVEDMNGSSVNDYVEEYISENKFEGLDMVKLKQIVMSYM